MIKIALPFFTLISLFSAAQNTFDTIIESEILSKKRQITIHLPASYEKNISKNYPVIYSLDGEYTQFIVNGTVDFYSYLDKIPECIVVSIQQNYADSSSSNYQRWIDCTYDWNTGFPVKNGILFKQFITEELVPYIDHTYRTTNFKTIIGHSFTANYINYFLFDEHPIFKGYVAISPYYAEKSIDSLTSVVRSLKTPFFYFVSSGEKDLSGHIQSVSDFDERFSKLKNNNFHFKKFDSKNNFATHYTIFPISLPSSIEHIFSLYSPISEEEFKFLVKEPHKIAYLQKRYEQIEQIYGLKIKIREDDLNTVAYAISNCKKWSELKELGELTIELYPASYSGYWMLGEQAEKTANYTAALHYYELGIQQLGADVLNIEDFQKDIDRVKNKID